MQSKCQVEVNKDTIKGHLSCFSPKNAFFMQNLQRACKTMQKRIFLQIHFFKLGTCLFYGIRDAYWNQFHFPVYPESSYLQTVDLVKSMVNQRNNLVNFFRVTTRVPNTLLFAKIKKTTVLLVKSKVPKKK